MIPAPPGWFASYRQTNPDHRTHMPVIAWNDEGVPLVADSKTGRLRPADGYSNFDRVGPATIDNPAPIVAVIPGGGWRVERGDGDGTWSEPLVAWGLDTNGNLHALDADSTGLVMPVDEGDIRIYHPDSSVQSDAEGATS